MAPHSSTLAWKIPWTEEPGRLQSMGSHRVGHDQATSLSLFTFMHWRRKWQPTRVLAWRIPGTGKPGGLPSMGSHRVGNDWSDLAAAEATEYLVSVVINVSLRQTGASRASQKMILQSPITMKEGSVKVAFLLQDRSKSFSPRENSKCNSFELLKSLM